MSGDERDETTDAQRVMLTKGDPLTCSSSDRIGIFIRCVRAAPFGTS